MAIDKKDLLLVQRGSTPYKTTAEDLASFTNTEIELGKDKDIPIASASQLGVIKVGDNLEISEDGTLSAEIPAGLYYKGIWTDADTVPSPRVTGDFYIWDGADATLNNTDWGSANSEAVTEGDRLFFSNNDWAVISGGGGGGLTQITGTAPVVVSAVSDGEQDVSMPKASASVDGYMPKEAFSKLDGIDPGANANINPTQAYVGSDTNGTLTLSPGGDTTTIPAATDSTAGLMTAADKANLNSLVSNPDGLVSVVAGPGMIVNTTEAPGSAASPELKVKFHMGPGKSASSTTMVMPADLNNLDDLPGD